MIRWCPDSNHDRWAAAWTAHWLTSHLAPDRAVIAVDITLDSDRRRLPAPPVPPPAGRVILVVRANLNTIDATSWLAVWSAAGLSPEIAHACDPLPGDENFDFARAPCPDQFGRSTAGIVLARRLTTTDLARRRLVIRHRRPFPGYLPLNVDQSVPLPVASGSYTAAQLADAYGVPDGEIAALIEELVWAGVASFD